MKTLINMLATVFYVGKLPKAPGTFGTLAALPIWWGLSCLSPVGYVAAVLVFCVFAIYVSNVYESTAPTHDASEIVIDEVAGFLVAVALLPVNIKVAIAGFVLFRFFDILKPPPIKQLDKKVKGGFGVVVDDLVAGLMANILLQFVMQTKPQWLI